MRLRYRHQIFLIFVCGLGVGIPFLLAGSTYGALLVILATIFLACLAAWRDQQKRRTALDRYKNSRKAPGKVPHLHILFRTCTRHSIKAAPRPCGASKREVVFCSLKSLLDALTPACTVHVLDDHSPEEDAAFMKGLLAGYGTRHKFIGIEKTGNGNSMEANFRYAKDNHFELVYFCEDDYIHLPGSIGAMVEFYEGLEYDCVIHPTDYIDRYTRDVPYPSLIFLGKDRHWRTVRHTTGTYLLSRRILEKYWKWYIGFAEFNKNKWGGEDRTINRIYQRELCLSPIPSLAAHFSCDPAMPPFVDWEGHFFKLARSLGLRN